MEWDVDNAAVIAIRGAYTAPSPPGGRPPPTTSARVIHLGLACAEIEVEKCTRGHLVCMQSTLKTPALARRVIFGIQQPSPRICRVGVPPAENGALGAAGHPCAGPVGLASHARESGAGFQNGGWGRALSPAGQFMTAGTYGQRKQSLEVKMSTEAVVSV